MLHGALLLGFAALAVVMARHEASSWVPYSRALLTVGTMCTLYVTLSRVPFEAIPWSADPLLDRLDRILFLGSSPVLWAEGHATRGSVEFFSFIYAIYIPYLYLSILLGCVGRPPEERDVFMGSMAIAYALGFLGYLFAPAHGPVVYLAQQFDAPLEGGFFHRLVVDSIQSVGGPHGAFPSLHIGSATVACLFDLRYNRLRGLTYLPIVTLIAVATVVVRYHYVVDLAAGVVVAAFASWAGRRWQERWMRRREAFREDPA
jgi:membrane-associated phospholipid phosphatase